MRCCRKFSARRSVIYFAYHAVQGDRGLIAWLQHSRELGESETVLAELAAERSTLEHRVSQLRAESLDPDMLEEQARTMLNFAEPDDRTLLLAIRTRALISLFN